MEDLKVGDLIKCMSFYDTGVTVGKVYQIDNLDDNKKRITFVDDDLDTRSIEIKNFNTYFKKVDNQLERNQKQRPLGGSTHYYELPENATELSHAIGEIKIIDDTMRQLLVLGIIEYDNNSVRNSNIGASNYAQHIIQPWSIIQDWELNYWDGDIIKRVLRTKNTDSRKMDYQKIIHICEERIRQIEIETIT